MIFTHRCILFVLLVAAIAALWFIGVDAPHVGLYNANNNYLALAAKNYFRFGFARLGFLPTYYAGAVLPVSVPYYLHHPILFFVVSAIPFAVFGFHNWVVHAGPFAFTLGIIVMMYRIGQRIWGRRVAVLAALLAAGFPMLAFFWKYMFFEQASVFFALVQLDILIRYVKTKHARLLLGFGLVTIVAALTDWYAGYFFVILAVFFVGHYRKAMQQIVFPYSAGLLVGFGGFLLAIFVTTGGFGELFSAIGVRSVGSELLALPYWPLRLGLLILLRLLIYFTPLAVAGLYMWREALRSKNQAVMLGKSVLTGLFAYGFVNVVFLPTATWGHSYFLFPFVPFFAYSIALFIDRYWKRGWLITLCSIVFVATSIAVNILKYKQTEKQWWKYAIAEEMNARLLAPYESVGVVNFPGDVMESYFFHPSVALSYEMLTPEGVREKSPVTTKVIISCWDTCTPVERAKIDALSRLFFVISVPWKDQAVWMIDFSLAPSGKNEQIEKIAKQPHPETTTGRTSIENIRSFYRMVRDFLGVGQI